MIDLELATELDALAQAIARMKPPSNRNPHAFHEDRSELASQARLLAQRCRTRPPPIGAADVPAPVTARLPAGYKVAYCGTIVVCGRGTVVMKREIRSAGVR